MPGKRFRYILIQRMVSKVSKSKFFINCKRQSGGSSIQLTKTNTALEDEHKSRISLGQQCFFQDALNVNKSFHHRKMPRPERIVNAKS